MSIQGYLRPNECNDVQGMGDILIREAKKYHGRPQFRDLELSQEEQTQYKSEFLKKHPYLRPQEYVMTESRRYDPRIGKEVTIKVSFA